GLGGDVNYVRATVTGTYVHELFEDVIGSVRGQAGHIEGFNGKSVRINDSFFKGPNLVRGFDSAGLGPRDMASSGLDALGAKTYAGASAEVTFPLGLPEEFGIRGAAFVDAGTAFGTDVSAATTPGVAVADSSALRASGGVSLLWESPIGPMRFDFAEAFLSQSFDQKQFFRFSGGTSF
ncbi:MAG: BamA/TamA family outer membrane protein, partial [Rhizobiales bacterium]|nr:BamA/TamA family outer membrane protein [Hyphomicrobiales bacterium]